tara:strand:- start:339 stop:461 length:123 start_codon:yes stop_codon:yes gene_type:complete
MENGDKNSYEKIVSEIGKKDFGHSIETTNTNNNTLPHIKK